MGRITFRYIEMVKKDFQLVKEEFPELALSLPLLVKKEPEIASITGYISVPQSIMNKLKIPKEIYNQYKFRIIAFYPLDFPKTQLMVKDYEKKIDWNNVPEEHRHRIDDFLCTHHPSRIIQFAHKDRSIEILTSAWKLYKGYLEYLETGVWRVKDLPHDYGSGKFF